MTAPRFRPPVIVVAVLGVAIFAVAVALRGVSHSGFDPTESAIAVTMYNDTSDTVTVKQCGSNCGSPHESDQLAPGKSVRVNGSAGSDDTWTVTGPDGHPQGCLTVPGDRASSTVRVSAARACPTHSLGVRSGLLGAVLGVTVFLLVAGVGIASMVFATAEIRRRAIVRRLPQPRVTVVTAVAALVAFLGGWLVFDFYVVLSGGRRLLQRRAATAG